MTHWTDPRTEEGRKAWVAFGVPWERSHPGYATWQEIEPRPAQYNWTFIDQYVTEAQASGAQILFTIWPFTDWDQLGCNLHLSEQPLPPPGAIERGKDPRDFLPLARRRGKPCDIEAYQQFLWHLVERYDGDGRRDMPNLRYPVKYWEIGNEPEAEFFFQGSAEDYLELLMVSYKTMKSVDPGAKVLHGGAGEWSESSRPFWEKVFQLGGVKYFDIANIHTPDPDHVAKFRQSFDKYGAGGKPIWVTEPGPEAMLLRKYGAKEGDSESTTRAFVEIFSNAIENGVERIFPGGSSGPGGPLNEAIRIIEGRYP